MEHELEKLVSRYQKAAERKQYWEPHWRECYEYAFPLRENVSSALYGSNEGERKNLCLYDGTAPDAVDQLASSLLAELTPPWAKWFGLRPGNELSPQEQEQVELQKISNGVWQIGGSVSLEAVSEALGVELPQEDYETFGGFVFGMYGYIPDDNTQFELDTNGMHIEAQKIEDHRLKKAIVHYPVTS